MRTFLKFGPEYHSSRKAVGVNQDAHHFVASARRLVLTVVLDVSVSHITCCNLPNTRADLEKFVMDSVTEVADGSDSDSITEELMRMKEVFGYSDSDSENYV